MLLQPTGGGDEKEAALPKRAHNTVLRVRNMTRGGVQGKGIITHDERSIEIMSTSRFEQHLAKILFAALGESAVILTATKSYEAKTALVPTYVCTTTIREGTIVGRALYICHQGWQLSLLVHVHRYSRPLLQRSGASDSAESSQHRLPKQNPQGGCQRGWQ